MNAVQLIGHGSDPRRPGTLEWLEDAVARAVTGAKGRLRFLARREKRGRLATTGLAGLLAAGILATAPDGARAGDSVDASPAVVTVLGDNASAITYWVRAPGGWHVVTTIDTVLGRETALEQHAIARFSSALLPGQSQEISVPVALGAPERALVIRRVGDQIETRLAGYGG